LLLKIATPLTVAFVARTFVPSLNVTLPQGASLVPIPVTVARHSIYWPLGIHVAERIKPTLVAALAIVTSTSLPALASKLSPPTKVAVTVVLLSNVIAACAWPLTTGAHASSWLPLVNQTCASFTTAVAEVIVAVSVTADP
jgi:hypothetical protein